MLNKNFLTALKEDLSKSIQNNKVPSQIKPQSPVRPDRQKQNRARAPSPASFQRRPAGISQINRSVKQPRETKQTPNYFTKTIPNGQHYEFKQSSKEQSQHYDKKTVFKQQIVPQKKSITLTGFEFQNSLSKTNENKDKQLNLQTHSRQSRTEHSPNSYPRPYHFRPENSHNSFPKPDKYKSEKSTNTYSHKPQQSPNSYPYKPEHSPKTYSHRPEQTSIPYPQRPEKSPNSYPHRPQHSPPCHTRPEHSPPSPSPPEHNPPCPYPPEHSPPFPRHQQHPPNSQSRIQPVSQSIPYPPQPSPLRPAHFPQNSPRRATAQQQRPHIDSRANKQNNFSPSQRQVWHQQRLTFAGGTNPVFNNDKRVTSPPRQSAHSQAMKQNSNEPFFVRRNKQQLSYKVNRMVGDYPPVWGFNTRPQSPTTRTSPRPQLSRSRIQPPSQSPASPRAAHSPRAPQHNNYDYFDRQPYFREDSYRRTDRSGVSKWGRSRQALGDNKPRCRDYQYRSYNL